MSPKPRRVTSALLRRWPLPDARIAGGKEERGRVLVVGGSREVPGACLLAGIAALWAGAGKLQVATASDVAIMLAIALPEAKVMGLRTDARGELRLASNEVLAEAERAHAVLIGPGMGDGSAQVRLATRVARDCPPPHHGEMAHLLGIDAEEVERNAADLAAAYAREYDATVILKGRSTIIAAADGDRWIHSGGSVGLGTSGSGDVLAGLVTGLLARGAHPAQAAVWGVSLHARAGAALGRTHGALGYLAREVAWSLRLTP